MYDFFFPLIKIAFATATPPFGSTTLAAVVTTQVGTAWDFIQAIIGVVWPFVLGVSILFGVIYLVIRVSRGAR